MKRTKKLPGWKLPAIVAGAAALMFIAGYLIATRILFPPLPEPENGIVVPSLSGLTLAEAQERLRPLDLRVTETLEVPSAQPQGLVVAQDPLPGQQLRELGAIRLGIAIPLPRPVAPAPAPDSTPAQAPAPAPAQPDSAPIEERRVRPDTAVPADTVSLSG